MDKKKFIDLLENQAKKDGVAYELALNHFLDYLLQLFNLESFSSDFATWRASFQEHLFAKHDFKELVLLWAVDVEAAMNRGEWLDLFGELYEEMYLSRGKASKTGQFFTPGSLSNLMSAIIAPAKNEVPGVEINGNKVNDCAAGSGRLLIAHYINVSKTDPSAGRRFYYVAQDSDPMACKMCALNMMIHGLQGEVICADTLSNDAPSLVYHVNEVRYPIPSPYYSIRKVSPIRK